MNAVDKEQFTNVINHKVDIKSYEHAQKIMIMQGHRTYEALVKWVKANEKQKHAIVEEYVKPYESRK